MPAFINPTCRKFKVSVLVLVGLIAVYVVSTGYKAHAQDNKAQNAETVAVVNMARIIETSQASQHIQSQVQKVRESLRNEFSSYKESLQQKRQELLKEKDEMSPKAFLDKKAQVQLKLSRTKNKLQVKRQKLEDAINKAVTKLRKHVGSIVDDMAKSNGYKLVLTRQNAIYADGKIDITPTVLKRLDDKIKKIDLKYSDKD